MWDERRARRLAAGTMLAFTAVVWIQIFDWGIVAAEDRYVRFQRQAARGMRPFVRAKPFMRPAIRESAWNATFWSAPIGLIGLTAVGLAARRQRP